jgi:hypothetical protein
MRVERWDELFEATNPGCGRLSFLPVDGNEGVGTTFCSNVPKCCAWDCSWWV